MKWGAILTTAATVSACTLFTPIGSDLTSDKGSDDGGAPSEAGAIEGGGDASGSNDASSAGDSSVDATGEKCAPGDLAKPIRAFDATPQSPAGLGPTCNPNGALTENDGAVAGLDRVTTSQAFIDGKDAVSCVGVEFATGVAIDAVVVRAIALASACGASPCNESSSSCGTGRSFSVYVGETESTLKLVRDGAEVGSTYETKEYPVGPTVTGRLVVACRAAWGLDRDDIGIDFLGARCR